MRCSCALFVLLMIVAESVASENNYEQNSGNYDNDWDRKDYENWNKYKIKPRNKDGGHPYRLKLQDDGLPIVGIEIDDVEDLERPCKLDDWICVRKVFAANSECKPVAGHVPDPIYLKENTIYFKTINVSVTLNKFRITGMSDVKIRDFYINKNTGNIVFSIDFRNMNHTTPAADFRYRRTGKESIVLTDIITVLYRSGTFTAVIPRVPKLRLDKAEIYADIHDGNPTFVIGPQAANSTDPDVVTAFANLLVEVPLAIRQGFLFLSNLLTSVFIQSYICDFGVSTYSY